jgi:hypothetical protein
MTAAFPIAFAAMIAKRELFYCPACKDRLDDSDMDTGRGWKHSQAMRDRYQGVCCKECTDAHSVSLDGHLCAPGEGVEDIDGGLWSSESALAEAEDEWAAEFSDRKAMRSWTR